MKMLALSFLVILSLIHIELTRATKASAIASEARLKDGNPRIPSKNGLDAEKFKNVSLQFVMSHNLHQSVTVQGRLNLSPEQTVQVRPVISGLVASVNVSVGDVVKKGDLLAVVESNEGLKKHKIRSPIAGVVVQNNAVSGKTMPSDGLFSISNYDELWAEFQVLPSPGYKLLPGQDIYFKEDINGGKGVVYRSAIKRVLPISENVPYLVAQAKLPSISSPVGLFPGALLKGRIITSEVVVNLAVSKTALQTMGGEEGVFALKDKKYIFVPLELGRRGDTYVEVISGLQKAEIYANENSSLIKLDMEKSNLQ